VRVERRVAVLGAARVALERLRRAVRQPRDRARERAVLLDLEVGGARAAGRGVGVAGVGGGRAAAAVQRPVARVVGPVPAAAVDAVARGRRRIPGRGRRRQVFRVAEEEAAALRGGRRGRGTVVVFGFGGAHLDQLDAVGKLYDATLPSWQRVATTTSALAAPPDDARLSAHAAALREAQFEVVAQACAAAGDVLVHVFSNNGAGAFAELLRRDPALAAKVRGVVFDSAATLDIGPNMADVVLGSVLGDLRRLEAPGATVAKVKDARLAANVAAVFAKPDGPTPMDAALAELVDATCPKAAPALFLYSSTDRLILAARVEEFADRVAAGRDDGAARLTRKVFDGSGHVRHLDAFPGEYAAAVGALVAAAMPEETSRVVG